MAAQKLGFGDDMAGLVGIGAGLYAGGMAGESMAASTAATTGAESTIGMDLSQADLSMASLPTPAGVNDPLTIGAGDLTGGNLAPAQSGVAAPIQGIQEAGRVAPKPGGMLTEGMTPDLSMASAPMASNPSTSSQLVTAGTTGGTNADPNGSWWEKLMSNGKMIDLAVAGIGGYGKAGIAKDNREYAEGVNKDNAQDWKAAGTSGVGRINTPNSYPSQNLG
jgi:hypothetical protein